MTRDYLDMPLRDFLGEVASSEPMPGAGYCAAISLGMAAGLVAMGARASCGQWPEAKGASAQADAISARIAPLAQRNAEAYAAAVASLQKTGADAQDLGLALERAAEVPLEIAEAAVDVASLAALVAERGEQALRADAVAAAVLALAAARAAATLVEVNLGTTASDERVIRARDLAGSATAAAERALATLA
jgi:formiminotetrahydrofolate cyclodeaminase